VHGKFCLTSLTCLLAADAMQCMQGCVYARLLGAYVCTLIEIGDCRAVVLGRGAFAAVVCWVLVGWVGPRGVYFVCLVPMRWLDWRGGSISLSIPFTFFF
jgi:hypothetical protein